MKNLKIQKEKLEEIQKKNQKRNKKKCFKTSMGLPVTISGALGAQTKILLPFNRSWQWGTSGSSSYWYNSVELYRQQSADNWKQVLEQLEFHISAQMRG